MKFSIRDQISVRPRRYDDAVGNETSLGAGQSQFPSTCWDILNRAQERKDAAADLNAVAQRYWRPVYRFIRAVWKRPVEDAKDLTQEFFATVFDRDFLKSADPAKGNFRQFVLASLRNFLVNDHRAAGAQKRGGGRLLLSMDVGPESETIEPADPSDPEASFNAEWKDEILRRALEQLESQYAARGHEKRFEAFRKYCLDEQGSSYREIAGELRVTEREVDYFLITARRDLRNCCVQIVRETVQDPAQVEDEMARLFGRLM